MCQPTGPSKCVQSMGHRITADCREGCCATTHNRTDRTGHMLTPTRAPSRERQKRQAKSADPRALTPERQVESVKSLTGYRPKVGHPREGRSPEAASQRPPTGVCHGELTPSTPVEAARESPLRGPMKAIPGTRLRRMSARERQSESASTPVGAARESLLRSPIKAIPGT